MKMLTGAYSQKFKDLEQDRLSRCNSSDSLTHSQQLAARDKVRQLSLETNKRRRAQELKRRLEAQKETKRRQEVLEERRRRQHEATQKYQRGQRGPIKPAPRIGSGKSYSDSRLQDGVHMARGYGQNATYSGNHGNKAPALEEALKMVGASTAPAGSIGYRGGGYGGGTEYSTGYRGGHNDGGATYNRENSGTDGSYKRPTMDANGNALSDSKGHSYHGYPTTATSTYNGNGNRDAMGQRFQQTLHEQQRQLMEQQQAALNEFNQAVQTETLPSQGEEVQRSSSLSSLDSLEEEQPRARKNLSRQSPGSAVSKSNQASTKPRTDHTADTVHTSPYGRNDAKIGQNGSSTTSDPFFTSHSGAPRHPSDSKDTHTTKETGNELLVEETSESDFVREPVESAPVFLQGSREVSAQHQGYGSYSSRGSQAWTNQTTANGPQFHHAYETSHSPLRYSSGPVSVQAGHQLFPARTTATAVSNYPARLQDPSSDYNQWSGHQMSEQDSARTAVPTTNPRTVNFSPASGKTSSRLQEEDSADREYPKQDGTLDTPERIVKSILKRTQGNNSASSQKVKLGGFKVKDSLEISRGSQTAKSDRKSVRWTDLNYVDEEDQGRQDKDHRAVSSSSSTSERSKASAKRSDDSHDTLQTKTHHVTVSGTPPRGPTKLQRKPHPNAKPPPSRSGHASSNKTPDTDNARGTSRSSNRIPYHQPETNNKAGVSSNNNRVYPNGIHLDKTPTDDEINWLWDKVRTCLHTQEQTSNGSDSSVSRQPASVSKQCIDGNRLTASLRVHVPSPPQDQPMTNPKKYNTYPRLRTNSDAGSASLRKTALLHQRRQHGTGAHIRAGYQGRSNQHYTGIQPSPPTSGNPHQSGSSGNNQGPMRSAAQDREVSDSLLAFQHAEHLAAQDNLSESDIAAAMEQPKINTFMQKAPTALSMEEQRILESLDKLNAQLRTVTSETNAAIQPYMMMQPKPPPQGSGYRSQRPISARQKAATNPTIANRVRTLSADRSNARINYYH